MTIFIGSVSAGLVAGADRHSHPHRHRVLCLRPDTAVDAVLRGFVTFDRVQSGSRASLRRTDPARPRAYYFDFAPELTHYLASVPPSRRRPWACAAVLARVPDDCRNDRRSHCGPDWLCRRPLATIAASHSAVAGFVTGGVVGALLVALMWFPAFGWAQAPAATL